MKLSRKKFTTALLIVLVLGAVVAIAIGYGGDIVGTAVKDSPLPTPTDTPVPPTDTPESSEPTDTQHQNHPSRQTHQSHPSQRIPPPLP